MSKAMPKQRKLIALKEWVTVHEAASHLASVFGEVVVEAGLFQWALNGQLTLSVRFINGAYARLSPPGWTRELDKQPGELSDHERALVWANGLKDTPFFSQDGGTPEVFALTNRELFDLPMVNNDAVVAPDKSPT